MDIVEEILTFLDTLGKNYRRNKNSKINDTDNEEEAEDLTVLQDFPKFFFRNEEEYSIIYENLAKILKDPKTYIQKEELD